VGCEHLRSKLLMSEYLGCLHIQAPSHPTARVAAMVCLQAAHAWSCHGIISWGRALQSQKANLEHEAAERAAKRTGSQQYVCEVRLQQSTYRQFIVVDKTTVPPAHDVCH
jgi:hypothetical protein